jgi:hypothetical protein
MTPKSLFSALAVVLMLITSGLTLANERLPSENTLVTPEYQEITTDRGENIILKRDVKAESAIQVSNCNLRFSTTLYGSLPSPNTFVVVYGPYSSKCAGGHKGYLNNLSNTSLELRLEQLQTSGVWEPVEVNGYIYYVGKPGNYRWVVRNLGASRGDWSLDIGLPI